jgi:hypothetical protein
VFDWLPESLCRYACTTLEMNMPRGRGQLNYRDKPRYLGKKYVKKKYHILFISYYATPAIIKKSIALRNSGQFYTTLIACCIRQDLEISRWFDQAYEIEHFEELFSILNTAKPWAVHVMIQPSLLGAIVLDTMKENQVVIDINDSMLFIDQDKNSRNIALEREVLSRADAIIHKMPKEAITAMRKLWNISSPDYLVHSLPVGQFCIGSNNGSISTPYRIVFAGGLIPYDIACTRGFENHIFDPLVDASSGQNIDLTFYVNQNARDMFWDEHLHYFNLEKKYPHFSFRKGVPFFELPAILSNYHFGIVYENIAEASFPEGHFAYNMSTKIFSYIEAGLPVLIHERSEYILNFIKEHSLGLVYSIDRLKDISGIIRKSDYKKLKRNVIRFATENNISNILPSLERAYNIK